MSSGVPPAGPKKRRKNAKPVDPDPVRLLHRNPGHAVRQGEHRDYTDNPKMAMSEEPEAIDATWQTGYSEQGETADKLRATLKLAGQQHRLKELAEKAELAGVDITRQALAIERQLKVIEAKTRRKAA